MRRKSHWLQYVLTLGLSPILAATRAPLAAAMDAPGTAASAPAQDTASREGESIIGSWIGTLDAGQKMRIMINIVRSADGKFETTLDSLDEGVKGTRIDETTFANGELTLTAKKLRATFQGKLGQGEITGKWLQGGLALPLVLKLADKPPQINRPQVPKKPYPYREREVTVKNSAAGIQLAGTLTIPESDRPCAAVLLISGSGPQDRDEAILGHQPFLVLADYLTRRGIVVLRLDDRGVGGSTGDSQNSTTNDLAADTLAAVEFLKSCPEVDPQRIGLVGHSEGGLIAPLAASRSSDVRFIVMVAGPGVTGEEILYEQGDLIVRAGGGGDAAAKFQRVLQEKLFAIVKEFARETAAAPGGTSPDTADVEKKLVVAATGLSALLPEEQRKAAEERAAGQARMMVTPWFRYFLSYDPRPTLAKVRCPVLAIFGERDLQVSPKQNLPAIEQALKAGGNTEYTLRELPELNHLLQTCQTGSPAEYGRIEETIAPAALAVIGDWISAQQAR